MKMVPVNPPPDPTAPLGSPAPSGEPPFSWTAERIDLLTAQWGTKPASAIGAELGTTRNAVLGKAHRLGLPIVKLAQVRPRKPTPQYRPQPKPLPLPQPSLNLTIAQLRRDSCRFPIESWGADMVYCGATTPEWPYCRRHHRIAYRHGGTGTGP